MLKFGGHISYFAQKYLPCQHTVGKKMYGLATCKNWERSFINFGWKWKRMSDMVKTVQNGYGKVALGAEFRTRWKLYKMALELFFGAWMQMFDHFWMKISKLLRYIQDSWQGTPFCRVEFVAIPFCRPEKRSQGHFVDKESSTLQNGPP